MYAYTHVKNSQCKRLKVPLVWVNQQKQPKTKLPSYEVKKVHLQNKGVEIFWFFSVIHSQFLSSRCVTRNKLDNKTIKKQGGWKWVTGVFLQRRPQRSPLHLLWNVQLVPLLRSAASQREGRRFWSISHCGKSQSFSQGLTGSWCLCESCSASSGGRSSWSASDTGCTRSACLLRGQTSGGGVRDDELTDPHLLILG